MKSMTLWDPLHTCTTHNALSHSNIHRSFRGLVFICGLCGQYMFLFCFVLKSSIYKVCCLMKTIFLCMTFFIYSSVDKYVLNNADTLADYGVSHWCLTLIQQKIKSYNLFWFNFLSSARHHSLAIHQRIQRLLKQENKCSYEKKWQTIRRKRKTRRCCWI